MGVLAFDLAYSGKTGWVVWDDTQEDPIADYGQFSPRGDGDFNKVAGLRSGLADVFARIYKLGMAVAFEETDWHRTLSNNKDARAQYAIERKAQSSLGMAKAVMLVVLQDVGIDTRNVYIVGANEAKREFGAGRKKAVAELLVAEYPKRLRMFEAADGFLWDIKLDQRISHHISDSMAIASVVSKRLKLNEFSRS